MHFDQVDLVEVFHRLGLNVPISDCRGYGVNTGQPGEAGTYRDALAWHVMCLPPLYEAFA